MDISNYIDDNTPHAAANDVGSLIVWPEEAAKSMFTWFNNYLMNSTADKCHPLVSSHEKLTIKISRNEITNTKREKLLGVHLDSKVSFD